MRALFYTLGCKLNQSESEALAAAFSSRGFSLQTPATRAEADIFIINSCTVTSKAEQKARRMIRAFARGNPAAAVLVTGCYAEMEGQALSELEENVVVLPMDAKERLLDLPEYLEKAAASGRTPLEAVRDFADSLTGTLQDPAKAAGRFRFDQAIHPPGIGGRSRAFLKIQDGCDNRCGYCRVRLARGPSVSLPARQVLERAEALEIAGYREIVVTGVNITAWKDLEGRGLAYLLAQLVQQLSKARIRLSSLEPDMIDPPLLEILGHQRICPHFHLPVQSGSDTILSLAGRKYSASKVLEVVAALKTIKTDPFLAADIIVGLPQEGEEDFQATLDLARTCGFAHLHAFPYSPRPDTPLYKAPGQVPQRIAGQRLVTLAALSKQMREAYHLRRNGETAEAIFERPLSKETALVLTDRYLHLACKNPPPGAKRGEKWQVEQRLGNQGLECTYRPPTQGYVK